MTDRLFINGLEVDLSGGTIIATTYQANNIGELQKRQGAYTNTFSIVMNDHNQSILEHSNLMNSNSIYPYQILTATLFQDDIETFTDGQVQIQAIENGVAKINVVAGNVDLSKAIGDLIVGELFADDIVYPWTLQNAYDSRDKSRYYIYPVIDWRIDIDTMFSSPSIDVRQLLPCALMTAIFERLENYTGYTFTGSYIESDEHQNMALTPSDMSVNPDYIDEDITKAYFINTTSSSSTWWYGDHTIPEGTGVVQFSENIPFTQNDVGFFNGSYYPSINHIGTLSFVGSFKISWDNFFDPYGTFEEKHSRYIYFVFKIKRDGIVICEETSLAINGKLPIDEEQFFSISTGEILLTMGSEYYCEIEFFVEQHDNVESDITWSNSGNLEFRHQDSNILVYGNNIRFRDLFRMKVKDVFYDILNLRGLMIQTNAYTREVQFNFFDDLIKNKAIAKDWSNKVDVNTSVLSYQFGKYAQRNDLVFKDNSEVTQDLGNFYFNVNDENLEVENTAVQIKHPATEQTNKYLGSNVPSIEGIDALNKWQKPEHRILQMSVQNSSYNVAFEDGTSTLNTTSNIPYCKFEGFDVLVPEYYNALTDILTRTKALGLVLNLTPIDIQSLDFSIPIFLDVPEMNINGYFYINKISNYRQGLTACELIRL